MTTDNGSIKCGDLDNNFFDDLQSREFYMVSKTGVTNVSNGHIQHPQRTDNRTIFYLLTHSLYLTKWLNWNLLFYQWTLLNYLSP